jgi:hypothetical protein
MVNDENSEEKAHKTYEIGEARSYQPPVGMQIIILKKFTFAIFYE